MKISRVSLTDFRQFYGKQELHFATSDSKNVTLIHAENGFGKTTILNAILWCLYEETTKKFERPKLIVNSEALNEARNSARVLVEFEHAGKQYSAQRDVQQINNSLKTRLVTHRINSGNYETIPTPDTLISSVIPREMAKHFFFDGEAAEAFSAERNYKEVGKAIRNILGCTLTERAIDDLKVARKYYNDQFSSVANDSDLENLDKQLAHQDSELEGMRKKEEQLRTAIDTYQDQRDEIVQRLRDMEAAKELQLRRDDMNNRLTETQQRMNSLEADKVKWLGKNAIRLVSRTLADQTINFVDEEELRGRIPSPYNEDFVKGLLTKEICICHRELKPQSDEWKAVASLLDDAANAEMLGRYVRARTRIASLSEDITSAIDELILLQNNIGILKDKEKKLEQDIGEISQKIKDLPIEEIRERERKREEINKRILEKQAELTRLQIDIESAARVLEQLKEERGKAAQNNKRAQRLLRRVDLAEKSADLLNELLRRYEGDARAWIQDQVNRILERVAHKDFTCQFGSSFSLELLLANGEPAPKSGGENQLLSLMFIAALVKFAKSRINSNEFLLKPGTVAPLVLDAPLGQLDQSYQAATAEHIPKLAEQVVLLLSSSQGDQRILDALEPYVGAEYVIVFENRGDRGKRPEQRRSYRGKDFIISAFNCDRDQARIERIL